MGRIKYYGGVLVGHLLGVLAMAMTIGCQAQATTPATETFLTKLFPNLNFAGIIPNITGNPTLLLILVLGGTLVATKGFNVDLTFAIPWIDKLLAGLLSPRVPKSAISNDDLLRQLVDSQNKVAELLRKQDAAAIVNTTKTPASP